MKIETRFNVDDNVYFMHENRVATGQVAVVQVYAHKPYNDKVVTGTKYYLKKSGKSGGGFCDYYYYDNALASKS